MGLGLAMVKKIIENNGTLTSVDHKKKLRGVASFDFAKFKSSQWKHLGTALYDDHYK